MSLLPPNILPPEASIREVIYTREVTFIDVRKPRVYSPYEMDGARETVLMSVTPMKRAEASEKGEIREATYISVVQKAIKTLALEEICMAIDYSGITK